MKTSMITSAVLALLLSSTVTLEAQRRSAANSTTKKTPATQETTQRRPTEKKAATTQETTQRRPTEQKSSSGQIAPDNRRDTRQTTTRNNNQNNQQTTVVKKNNTAKHYDKEKVIIVTNRPERTVVIHDHDHARIQHHGCDYYYSEGHYYKHHNDAYIAVAPPRGMRVTYVPHGFITIMVAHVPYFYYSGVYYREIPKYNYYEVVAPPMGAIVPELPGYDVNAVVINGRTYFEYDNILYKPVGTRAGVQYKVIGILDDAQDIY